MYLVLLGLLLLTLKLAELGSVAAWSWWVVLSPFAGAVIWWAWADATGYYKRREMRQLEQRQEKRRERSMEAIGTKTRGRRGR